jgi:AcrR family transcriptional regulator
MKTQALLSEPKPYHHGDLRRALLRAAVTIIEREGPSALSLRAVAREAGVSPAAPYHHFKDKAELLDAVAQEGFSRLKTALAEAFAAARSEAGGMNRSALGVAYVEFSRANPALYRVMWDCARNGSKMPEHDEHDDSAFELVRQTLREAAGGEISDLDLELTAIASWCAAHGLAEISTFAQFGPLKDQLGGEREFLVAVLEHLGGIRRHRQA